LSAPFANRALVGDNDYMFHRVGAIGDPERWPWAERFSTKARLEYRGSTGCVVDDDDDVKVAYDIGELRISLLWRGICFADATDEVRYDRHEDDLDLFGVERIIRRDLEAKGIEHPESHDLVDDPAWVHTLTANYGFPDPEIP
jgi:hypothetical protein